MASTEDKTDFVSAETLKKAIEDSEKRTKEFFQNEVQKLPVFSRAVAIVTSFFASGFFFLLLGGALLFLAQHKMATNHAGITFILVVLGVALILYGTGSQGSGQIKSDTAVVAYNIAIAGGAGVIAFVVAYGILKYSPSMRQAFQPETQFVRLLIQSNDGSTALPKYASFFEVDGRPAPAARRGKLVEVYVPYTTFGSVDESIQNQPENQNQAGSSPETSPNDGICPSDENRKLMARLSPQSLTKTISANFYRVRNASEADSDTSLKQSEQIDFRIKLDPQVFETIGAGAEFPIYPVRMCVSLQAVNVAQGVINTGGQQSLRIAPTALPPNPPPAALIEAH